MSRSTGRSAALSAVPQNPPALQTAQIWARSLAIGAGFIALLGSACNPAPPPPAALALCPTTSIVALLPASRQRVCPALPATQQGVLFRGTYLSSAPLASPDNLAFDYCKYDLFTAQGTGRARVTAENTDELRRLLQVALEQQGLPGQARVERDCPVLVPSANVGNAQITREEALQHLSEVVAEDAGPLSLPVPVRQPSVRVAVVDTAEVPFEELLDQDVNVHGRAVGLTISTLGCGTTTASEPSPQPAPRCPIEIRNQLGLPIVDAESDRFADGHGGNLGTRSDLGAAIRSSLDAWNPRTIPHLLLNFSVGWQGQHNEELMDELAPELRVPTEKLEPLPPDDPLGEGALATASLYWLLQEAACRGALTIAAAGNALNEDQFGPLYPGGWEALPASDPGSVLCRVLVPEEALRGPSRAGLPPVPMVYAASGVDHGGELLVTTRAPLAGGLGGLARRTALGLFVVASEPRPAQGPFTTPLSGTSMSAAIVSGTAARLWSDKPGLSAHDVMAVIDGELETPPNPELVNLCLGGPPCVDQQHGIVRLCGALGQACPKLRAPEDAYLDALAPATELEEPLAAADAGSCPVGSVCPVADSCGVDSDCTPPVPVIHALLEPWVLPQPGGPVCSLCSVRYFSTISTFSQVTENRLPASSGKPWLVRLYDVNGASTVELNTSPYWTATQQTLWFANSGANRVSAGVNIAFDVVGASGVTSQVFQLEIVPLVNIQ